MRILRLKHDYRKAEKLEAKHPVPSDVDQVIDRDVLVEGPDQSTIAMLLTKCIASDLWHLAYAMWSTAVKKLPSARPTAVGTSSLPSPRKDGTLSEYHGVHKFVLDVIKPQGSRSDRLGFVNGRKTRLTVKRPELLEANRELIERVNALYAHYSPRHHAKQLLEVKKGRCRIWHTAFSTVYIIKQTQTAYHADSNLPGALTAILCCGNFTGGALVMPRWRLAFAYRPGDLLLFDEGQLHGNLPFAGERLSAAFYCAPRIAPRLPHQI